MKTIITLLLFTVALGTAAAQELPPMEQVPTQDSVQTSRLWIQAVPDSRNEISVQIAGYELLLERDYPSDNHQQPTAKKRPHNKSSKYKGRIRAFEFGFNGYAYGSKADYSMYPEEEQGFMDLNIARSGHYTFNIFTFSSALVKSQMLGMTMGVGLTVNDYTLETPVLFEKRDGMLRPVEPQHELKKSKLNTVALHIPLALEFNPSRKFFISAGAYLDLMLGSHTKSKFPKEKVRAPYTNFVHAGITVRAGFKNFYLFGSYGFTELFRPGKGPGVNPYSFGVGFGY